MADGVNQDTLEEIHTLLTRSILQVLRDATETGTLLTPTQMTSIRQFLADQGFSKDWGTSTEADNILKMLPKEVTDTLDLDQAFGC